MVRFSKFSFLFSSTITSSRSLTLTLTLVMALTLAMMMALTLATFMTLFIVPSFGDMFRDLGAELPWQTQALLRVSDFVAATWYILLPLIVA